MFALSLKRTAAVAASYAIVGLIALQLAVPPGYAAPVYPAAGIAVAAAFIYGWPAVAGAALGSLLVNALARLIDGNLSGIEFAIPLATAAGAALQASFGAWLLHRFVGEPLRLETPGEYLSFALLAGPVACLVSSSVAALGFHQASTVPAGELAYTWWTWWTGDTIGVLIAAPIVFALVARPRSIWAPRRIAVALPLAVATVVVGLGIAQVGRWENERLANIFRHEAAEITGDLKQSFNGHLSALHAIQQLFDASEEVTADEFRRATAHWLRSLPSLHALGWSARVPAGQQAAFEQQMRIRTPGYRIFNRAADGSRRSPDPNSEAIAVAFIEPRAGNDAALGVNALSIVAANEAIGRTVTSNEPQATATFRLTQQTDAQSGVVIYLPVRHNGTSPSAPVDGVVFATMRMNDALSAVTPATRDGLLTCLFDATGAASRQPIAGGAGCASPAAVNQPALTLPMPFAGRQWLLQVRAEPAFLAANRDWTAWWFSVAALVTTGLLGAVLLVASGRTQRTQELVDERTAALRREIAERQIKEQALLAAEQRFGDVFEAASVGLAYTDLQARFVRVNARFCQITGFSADALEKLRADEITESQDAPVRSHVIQLLIDGQRSRFRTREHYVRPDGSRIPVEVTHSLSRDANGQPLYLVMAVEDLRERIAREAAEASNRAKTEFLSRMSHELRTPLNAMLGFAQLMQIDRGTPLAPAQRERIDHIQSAGWHLLEMINDVLDLSRIESGSLRLSLERLDLRPLVNECQSMQHDLLRSRDVRLSTELAEDARFVAADATRLRQVLSNLLSNAIKYNRRGGRVTVRAERGADGTVILSVTDTGAGLSTDEIGQLFQPFNRLGRERSEISGTGIGLVIARGLVELMQGRLEVESTPGEGSTFRVVLQSAPAPHDQTSPATDNRPSMSTARRVVYIEDNAVNVEVVRGMLQLAGPIELQVFERGLDGLRGVLAAPPDLLLLDLHLPDISGLEVLRQLRAVPALAELPIIIVSADAMNDQVSASIGAGADAYLTKPIELDHLLQLLEEVFGNRRHAAT